MNRPKVDVTTYTFDGPMAYDVPTTRTPYAPNTEGRPFSDLTGPADDSWEVDGDLVRSAATVRPPRTTTTSRRGSSSGRCSTTPAATSSSTTSSSHLKGGVTGDVLQRAFQYWTNIDAEIGRRIEEGVTA